VPAPEAVPPVITFDASDGRLVIVAEEAFDADAEAKLLSIAADPAWLAAEFGRLRAQEAVWSAAASPAQLAITWGDCFRFRRPAGASQVVSGLDLAGETILPEHVVYGRVWTVQEFAGRERKAGAPEPAIRREIRRLRGLHDRGWRYGTCWSELVPAGDTGRHHAGYLEPLTAGQLHAARRAGWPT
jgi:hypothetical protein